MLYAAIALLVAFILWRNYTVNRGVVSISPTDVQARQQQRDKLVVVDVRGKGEYDQGHIPGARLIPLHTLPEGARDLPKDAEIVLVCRSGNRSAQAYQLLKKAGYTNLLNMSGGMLSWNGKVVR